MTWLKSYMDGLPDVGYPFGDNDVTGIRQLNNSQTFTVYPNPVISGKVTIRSESAQNIKLIEIFDLQGKIVRTLKPTQLKSEIDINTLKKGIYYVRVQAENTVESKKLVIL